VLNITAALLLTILQVLSPCATGGFRLLAMPANHSAAGGGSSESAQASCGGADCCNRPERPAPRPTPATSDGGDAAASVPCDGFLPSKSGPCPGKARPVAVPAIACAVSQHPAPAPAPDMTALLAQWVAVLDRLSSVTPAPIAVPAQSRADPPPTGLIVAATSRLLL
jgi:hypothetical protein